MGVNTTQCITVPPRGQCVSPGVYLHRRRSRGADNRSLDSSGRRGGQEVFRQDVQSFTGIHGGLQEEELDKEEEEEEKERDPSFSIRPSRPGMEQLFDWWAKTGSKL